MIEPRPEERNHVGVGPTVGRVRVGEVTLFCLTRGKRRSLLWTADVGAGRAAGLPVSHRGSFLGWVENERIEFLTDEP